MNSETGPGRFAVGGAFELVQQFFQLGSEYADNGVFSDFLNETGTAYELSKAELVGILGLTYYGYNLDQKDVSDGFNMIEQIYIWNITA